ncbi:MAG: 16S rRNA (cytosine(1402)-N(4))-methyltransferase RsmH [Bacteroidota bacterium]
MTPYHVPVLLAETLDLLEIKEDGVYVDVTFGGGGHSRALLARLKQGKLIAFDRDPDARRNIPDDPRIIFIPQNFALIESALEARDIKKIDGLIADLGISSHQIDTAERGFSYRFEAQLDMRMNPTDGQTAADILNSYEERDLVHLFSKYGEVNNAKKLVRTVIEGRRREEIRETSQFEGMIQACIPPKRRAKYLAQVYQALRIEVNGEMEALQNLLLASVKLLNPGGRIAVMSYHSLEDRLVKRFFRSGNLLGVQHKDLYGRLLSPWKVITRKAVMADEAEVERNPRARSARLRVAERQLLNEELID